MKKDYIPYYLSRAALSAVFSILVMGFNWKALLLAVIFFGLFLLYLHSGWFTIDLSHPIFPLRRDARGRQIQRQALITAVVVGLIAYIALAQATRYSSLASGAGNLALPLAVIVYFTTQFVLLARS